MRNGVTVRGQWMYERTAVARVAALARAGLIALDASTITSFPLAQVNESVAHAAAHAGPFQATVLRPQQ